jgi:dTDP-4-amino-4,6-dideoxygalactose transaminase
VQVNDRDKVIKEFENSDIGYGIHYPEPIHKQKAFSDLATPRVSLEVSERAAERILSLPIYPGLKLEQQMMVIETLRSALL